MLYILHGEDDFSLRDALDAIKGGLGDKELLATNTIEFEGAHLTLEKLSATCDALPFLAPWRLVIVNGLLARFEGKKGQPPSAKALKEWQPLTEYVSRMPEGTVLVLVDGKIGGGNALFKGLAARGKVKMFPFLRAGELQTWVGSRVRKSGSSISPQALRLLVDLIGANLWSLSSEIDKLCLYTEGRGIEEDDVRALVSFAREASVFAMADAILDRDMPAAIRQAHKLLEEGGAPPYLLTMITRQFRLVIQAKDLMGQGLRADAIRKKLDIPSEFVAGKAMKQAQKNSQERLAMVYSRLLDADISIKTGRLEGGLALDLLLGDLCGSAHN